MKAVAAGHRVVVVYATDGAHGNVPTDLGEIETVEQRRQTEALAAAEVVGTTRVVFLGFRDSGMTGWSQNEDPDSFHLAEVDEAARRLAVLLDDEQADVLVGYDWHGSYGHPDHVKVHAVTYRAAELARRTPRVLESTHNTDAIASDLINELMDVPEGEQWLGDDGLPVGTPEAEITWQVDVRDLTDRKRQALRAHASQNDASMLASLPSPAFEALLGFEYYIERGVDGPMRCAWPF
ncbi:hypothetical protein HMPREF1531_02139 [Propionibacterium sp. oral taxon 192 str. F0372]|nr:hypothetical protein HMPREF1531_02139 [Propionibacterium sp. oral taxon 192 str. F0372]